MTDDELVQGSAQEQGSERSAVSRRKLLAGGGAAVAGLSIAGTRRAFARAAAAPGQIGVAPDDKNAMELLLKIDQEGFRFFTYGFFTHIAGLGKAALFSGPGRRDAGRALFTFFGESEMQTRSVFQGVHALSVVGPLDVYVRRDPGADFDVRQSFKEGRRIARFDGDFQSVLNVATPPKGTDVIEGSLAQTEASRFMFNQQSRLLGRAGARYRVSANGLGTLLDAAELIAVLHLAGNLVLTHLPD